MTLPAWRSAYGASTIGERRGGRVVGFRAHLEDGVARVRDAEQEPRALGVDRDRDVEFVAVGGTHAQRRVDRALAQDAIAGVEHGVARQDDAVRPVPAERRGSGLGDVEGHVDDVARLRARRRAHAVGAQVHVAERQRRARRVVRLALQLVDLTQRVGHHEQTAASVSVSAIWGSVTRQRGVVARARRQRRGARERGRAASRPGAVRWARSRPGRPTIPWRAPRRRSGPSR